MEAEPFPSFLDDDSTLAEEAGGHLPLVFDVPTVFALAASLEAAEPIILDAASCTGRIRLESNGWSLLDDLAHDAGGRVFQVYAAANSSGQVRQLWIEHGVAVDPPEHDAPVFSSEPLSFLHDTHAFAHDAHAFLHDPLPLPHEFPPVIPEQTYPSPPLELTCNDVMALDANLLTAFAPDGAVLRGGGALLLGSGDWAVASADVLRDGLAFTEYVGRNEHGDTISLLIQQGIVVL